MNLDILKIASDTNNNKSIKNKKCCPVWLCYYKKSENCCKNPIGRSGE